MIWKDYRDLFPHNVDLIAHLFTECNSMSEYCDWQPCKNTNDRGWAIGMSQIHLKYRESEWLKKYGWNHWNWNACTIETVRHQFFEDHPEMKTWRGQVNRYLTEMQGLLSDYSIDEAIRSWNRGDVLYLSKVKSNIPTVLDLLQ